MDVRVDDHRVFAATGGRPFEPAGPVAVFVHGAGLDHTIWSQQARWFAHHGRPVLAVDLPGRGRSDGPPLPTVRAGAGWLVRLLDAVGVEQAAVVGHGLGALITLEAAARHPRRMRAIALMGAAVRLAMTDDVRAAAAAHDPLAIDLLVARGHDARTVAGGRAVPGMSVLGTCRRLLQRTRPEVLRADLEAWERYDDALDAAARIECTTLVLLGETDRFAPPAAARALADAITRGYSIPMAGCGHMAMTERPDATTDALRHAI